MEHDRIKKYKKLEQQIGKTPIIEVIKTERNNRIFAKLEYKNPTGSHHDRQYIPILRNLEHNEKIKPGKTNLIEVSSGNAGTSFAWICKEMGFNATVIVPSELPENRIKDISRFDANIIINNEKQYIKGCVNQLKKILIKDKSYYCVNHSRDIISAISLEEIAKEAIETIPTLSVFITVIGSGSTLLGVGKKMKSLGSHIYAWEPFSSAYAYEMQNPNEFKNKFGLNPGFFYHSIYGASFQGVSFPHVEQAMNLLDSKIILITDSEQEKEYFKLTNKNSNLLSWEKTGEELGIGRTSKGTLALAKEIEKRYTNTDFLIIFYDPDWKY